MTAVTAADILAAIREHHGARAAIVPELTISDDDWDVDPACKVAPTRRIDALMFQSLVRTAIEIKISEADFNRDTWEKRRAWWRVCHRFVYVVPADLDIRAPWKCGLWRVGADGRVVVATKASVNVAPEPLPQSVVQALAYRAVKAASTDV